MPQSNLYGVLQALILLANTALGLWIARKVTNVDTRVGDVHHEMNSMKDQLVASVKDAATQRGHAAGLKEAQEKAETAALNVIAEPVGPGKQGEAVTLEAPVKIEVTTKKE
jgi:hypothetical protein